jgi:hypothetical protein
VALEHLPHLGLDLCVVDDVRGLHVDHRERLQAVDGRREDDVRVAQLGRRPRREKNLDLEQHLQFFDVRDGLFKDLQVEVCTAAWGPRPGTAAVALAAALHGDDPLGLRIRQSEAIPVALATFRPWRMRALRAAPRGRAAPRARRPFSRAEFYLCTLQRAWVLVLALAPRNKKHQP